MKNSKLFSYVLALTFIFVTVMGCFSATSAFASTIELKDDDYIHAVNTLSKIAPDFPLNEGEVTTRAEFVAAVTMAMDVTGSVNTQTGFLDVPADHIYAKNIAFALGNGLISNVDLFYPDSPITYTQAIKIVMVAAGYGVKAEYNGGYPTGYLKVANEIDLGKSLSSLDVDDTLTHAQAIDIIFEAVTTDMLEMTGFGSNTDYSVTKGKNILSTYHKIYMAEGVVEANENTGIASLSSVSADNTIIVDGKKFTGEGYDNLIGKRARIFYGDDSKNTIVYAYECGNDVATYTYKDELEISGTKITAYPEEGTKEVKHTLEGDYSVIYNGKFFGAANYSSHINTNSGSTQLVDNDDNGKIDVIIIKEYEYGVVGSVNEFEERIYDKYKKNGLIDLSGSETKYSVSEYNGDAIALDQLESGDVVGYAISKDNKYYEIVRFPEKIGGTYNTITSEGKIEFKGKEYELTTYYTSNVKSLNNVKKDTEIILYLGVGDQVVYIQEFEAVSKYGFLVDTCMQSGMDGRAMVKIYSADGEMLELECADKLTFNGAKLTSQDTMLSNLEATKALAYAYRVIKYSLSAEGKLSKVFTATDNTQGTNVLYTQIIDEARPVIYYDSTALTEGGVISDDPVVSVPYSIEESACPYYCAGVFTPYFNLVTGSTIMQIPVRPIDFSDDEKYRVNVIEDEQYYRAVAYDVTTGGAASFVLISKDFSGGGAISRYNGSAIIESITQGLNEDGEEATVLKLYYDGKWDKYYYDSEKTKISRENTNGNGTLDQTDLDIDDFAPGDIIRISATADKVITEMTMNFDCSAKTVPSEISQSPSNGGRYVEYILGYALSVSSDNQIVIGTNKTISEIVASQGDLPLTNTFSGTLGAGNTVFVRINRDRNTNAVKDAVVYKEANLNSIETYFNSGSEMDYVVLRRYYREPTMNIIYVNIDS